MKKKFLTLFFILILLGGGVFYFYYKFYEFNNPLYYVTVFQSGIFQNSVNAYEEARKNNGIVVKDNDFYRVYIAVYQDDAIIERMSSYYKERGINCHLKQIRVDEDYVDILNKYESMLNISNDESIIPNLNSFLVSSLESHL